MKTRIRVASLAACAWLALPGLATADAVTDWNETAAASVAAGRPGPIGQVDLALVAAAMHDAVQAIERRFESYYVEVPGATGSRSAAVAAAAHDMLVAFYPAQAATLTPAYDTWLANNGLTGNPGIAVGQAVAAKMKTLRRLDPVPAIVFGGEPGVIGKWRPTPSFLPGPPPSLANMAVPWMGSFEPFGLTGPARFRAPPPPALTSLRYTRDYNEVKEKGALTGSTRTPEETDLAYFWTDNFAVQFNRAARAIINNHVHRIGDSARLLALMNISIADALITSWDSKRFYNIWRPITAINEGEFDGNPMTEGDPEWQSLVNNPNYPDYTSGANNVAGATTKTLELFFNRDRMDFEITSNAANVVNRTRTYRRFSQAAQEVVDARVLLGIHFRFADTAARRQGRQVAEYVFDHLLLPIVPNYHSHFYKHDDD
ncbi:MAG TPA: vanadium-dependent haloperoxidase [Steroidobacteraceae bacterium]|nr:vanadium-dependent haloperoxidase [Steroidobacteraceae bacterium]